jgi:hypothetical protein
MTRVADLMLAGLRAYREAGGWPRAAEPKCSHRWKRRPCSVDRGTLWRAPPRRTGFKRTKRAERMASRDGYFAPEGVIPHLGTRLSCRCSAASRRAPPGRGTGLAELSKDESATS